MLRSRLPERYSISTSYSYASANKKLEILIVFNKGITNQRLKYYKGLIGIFERKSFDDIFAKPLRHHRSSIFVTVEIDSFAEPPKRS